MKSTSYQRVQVRRYGDSPYFVAERSARKHLLAHGHRVIVRPPEDYKTTQWFTDQDLWLRKNVHCRWTCPMAMGREWWIVFEDKKTAALFKLFFG